MPGKHDNNASLYKHEVKAKKKDLIAITTMQQDYVVHFIATFYGVNDTQRIKLDSNMLWHTSLLSHNQSCNI
jgi:hypothetical protein